MTTYSGVRHIGVVTGVVTDVEDPLGEGRVRLRYGWMPGHLKSAWAPIASPLGGPSRGLWFMPEKDDEVLVAFDHGDFDHPFVVGYLWNGAHHPPDTDVQHRVLVTPGGHQLRFEDNDGARQVVLRTADGHVLTLTDAGQKVTLESSGGLRLTLDDGGQVASLTAGDALSVTLDQSQPSLVLRGGGRQVAMQDGRISMT